jgi:hypothetical protein
MMRQLQAENEHLTKQANEASEMAGNLWADLQEAKTENERLRGMMSHPVFSFLLGEGELEGHAFSDNPPISPNGFKRRHWWRSHLREALQREGEE